MTCPSCNLSLEYLYFYCDWSSWLLCNYNTSQLDGQKIMFIDMTANSPFISSLLWTTLNNHVHKKDILNPQKCDSIVLYKTTYFYLHLSTLFVSSMPEQIAFGTFATILLFPIESRPRRVIFRTRTSFILEPTKGTPFPTFCKQMQGKNQNEVCVRNTSLHS